MRRVTISVLLGILLICQGFATAMEQDFLEYKEERFLTSYNTNALQPQLINEQVQDYYANKSLQGREFNAYTLEKGSVFYVKSLQPMNSDTPKGARIEFEAETNLFSPDKLSQNFQDIYTLLLSFDHFHSPGVC